MLTVKERLNRDVLEPLRTLVGGRVLFDEPMSQHTTFGVGGSADAWVEPNDSPDLARVLDYCASKGLDRIVLGQGTNMLVRDGGIRGVILRLHAPAFRGILVDGTRVVAAAGVANTKLLEAVKAAGLGGLEFICGIPGCVGGGVAMNAGAHDSCYGDWLTEVTLMDKCGEIYSVSRSALDFGYRCLRNLGDAIILSAEFNLKPESADRIQARVNEFLRHRNLTQPKGSSPGCVFKNPPGQSAGKIIDGLGLKGLRVGGAWVSELHGNFILNDRTATSAEVLELIEKVRSQVLTQTGIFLSTEVKIVGEP